MRALAVTLFLALPTSALAAPTLARVIVLPVTAEMPPPGDPTLLRVSQALAESVAEVMAGDVRLVPRERRDALCGLSCPPELADLADVDAAIVLRLSPRYAHVDVEVWGRRAQRLAEGRLSCSYVAGRAVCAGDGLATILAAAEPAGPYDEAAVLDAFRTLEPHLLECFDGVRPTSAAHIRFRVFPDGRVSDVHVEPKRLAKRPGFACVARTAESLRVRPFKGKAPASVRAPLFAIPDSP